jgi:hypothetical protein
MNNNQLISNEAHQLEQACKDANIALTLALISIYGSTIPLLGIVTALVAERIAHKTPDVKGISNVQTKKNVVHLLTPVTFLLSILFFVFYYYMYKQHGWF